MAVEPSRRRFTVEEFHRMADAGLFYDEDERVELIDGEVFELPPMNPAHAGCVQVLTHLLITRLAGRAWVGSQSPVVLDDLTQPHPDLWVARLRSDHYRQGHPGPEDLHLVVEVADSSALVDRRWKIPRYARSGVAEAWLADLQTDCFEVYQRPGLEGYGEVAVLRRGDSVSSAAFPDVALEVADILGPPTH